MMKRFLKAVFWWDTPKAGAFWGMLFIALVTGIVPSTILYCNYEVPKAGVIDGGFRFFGLLHNSLPLIVWFSYAALAYSLVLFVLYTIRAI